MGSEDAPSRSPAALAGSSIAEPGAALWVTDFLNAAFYARARRARSVDDLRLAWTILRTFWHRRGHRRLRGRDLAPFHRAFGRARLRASTPKELGRLDRDELLDGAATLLGSWFVDGWSDPGLRAWGIVFEDEAELRSFQPEARLEHAALGPLTPPVGKPETQTWHTYPAVPVRSAEATAAALLAPSRWPDFGSALGQFVPLRSIGLLGQTFEIEIVVRLAPRAPLLARAYVTATRVLDGPGELEAWARDLNAALAASSGPESTALPSDGRPVVGVELTTHDGHVMGAATSNLLLFEQDGEAFLRDVGQWDPLPRQLAVAYERKGAAAQRAFWGDGPAEDSVLHQFAAPQRGRQSAADDVRASFSDV